MIPKYLSTILKSYTFREALRAEFEEDISFLVRNLPGLGGFILRYLVYKPLFGEIASMPYIYPGVRFVYMRNINLSKGVLINSNTYVYGKGGIDIGDYVLISPNCAIVAGDHNTSINENIIDQSSIGKKIVIKNNCWIGANSVVLKGVTIGEGAIIGAGAVVTKDIEPYSINVGVPTRKIGIRE